MRARQHVLQRFSVERMQRDTLAAYTALLASVRQFSV
jgi:hypothetical protein